MSIVQYPASTMAALAVASLHCAAPRPNAPPRHQTASSSSRCSTRQLRSAASTGAKTSRRATLVPRPRAAGEEVDEVDVEVEAEVELDDVDEADGYDQNTWGRMQRLAAEAEAGEPQKRPILRVTQQHGLVNWEPSSGPAAQEPGEGQGEGEEAGTSGEVALSYEELLQRLPGLQRQMRAAAQERAGLPPLADPNVDEEHTMDRPYERVPRKPEPVYDEWDLRAKMEKRRRQLRDWDAWMEAKSRIGMYPQLAADWRSDIRCRETGNPTDPAYREWTHMEIWNLITNNDRNADPRMVQVFVRDPNEIADIPAQGGQYNMDPEEYFESLGRLIHEDDLALIVDKDAEVALLAAEFSDFDEELLPGSNDYDSDFATAAAAEGSAEEDF